VASKPRVCASALGRLFRLPYVLLRPGGTCARCDHVVGDMPSHDSTTTFINSSRELISGVAFASRPFWSREVYAAVAKSRNESYAAGPRCLRHARAWDIDGRVAAMCVVPAWNG